MPKAHILIVEDDRIVAEDTKITLEKLRGMAGRCFFVDKSV